MAQNLVLEGLQGINGTVFAYGQTGSGKTFTITGGPEHYADRGIIPRSISLLFSTIAKHPDSMHAVRVPHSRCAQDPSLSCSDMACLWECATPAWLRVLWPAHSTGGTVSTGCSMPGLHMVSATHAPRHVPPAQVHISYLEVYNEAGYDLLDPDREARVLEDLRRVHVMEDEAGAVHIRNLSMHRAATEEEALNLVGRACPSIADCVMLSALRTAECVRRCGAMAAAVHGRHQPADLRDAPEPGILALPLHLHPACGVTQGALCSPRPSRASSASMRCALLEALRRAACSGRGRHHPALQAEHGRSGRERAREQDARGWQHPARGQAHQSVAALPGAGHHRAAGRGVVCYIQWHAPLHGIRARAGKVSAANIALHVLAPRVLPLIPQHAPELTCAPPLQERSSGQARAHVPYRNCMMTTVLRDSLGGNCRTVMIATVTAEAEQVDESISTCRFAQRVALVSNQVLRGCRLPLQAMSHCRKACCSPHVMVCIDR